MDKKTPKPPVVALYLRGSTSSSDEEVQRFNLMEYVEKRGYTIFKEYLDHGYGGDTQASDRKYAPDVIEDARLGRFQILLVTAIDRIARDEEFGLNYLRRIEETGCKVNFVDQPYANTPDVYSPEMADIIKNSRTMLLMGARMEHTRIKARTRGAKIKWIKENKWPSSIIPDGYLLDKTDDRYALVINPVRASVIKHIFSLYIDDNLSARQIRDLLNKEGMPSYKGRPWGKDTIQDKLSNRLYTGKLPINGKKLGPLHVFTCEPIISDERFEEAQAKKRERSRRSERSTKREYMLGDYMWCASCGLELNCITSGAHRPVSETYHYGYRKPNKGVKFKKRCPNGCGKISEIKTVGLLYEHMAKFIADSSVEDIVDWLENGKTKYLPGMREELVGLESRHKVLLNDCEQILDLFPDIIKTRALLQKKLAKKEAEMRDVEEKIRFIKQNIVNQEEKSERLKRLTEFATLVQANMRLVQGQDLLLTFDKELVGEPDVDDDGKNVVDKILHSTEKTAYQFQSEVVRSLLKFVKKIEVAFPDSSLMKELLIDPKKAQKGFLRVITKVPQYLDGQLSFGPDPKRRKGRPKKEDANTGGGGDDNNGGNAIEKNSHLRLSERIKIDFLILCKDRAIL